MTNTSQIPLIVGDVEHTVSAIITSSRYCRWREEVIDSTFGMQNPQKQIKTSSGAHISQLFTQTYRGTGCMTHAPRATLLDGADVVQATVMDVAALKVELLALALKVFLFKHSHLWRRSTWGTGRN